MPVCPTESSWRSPLAAWCLGLLLSWASVLNAQEDPFRANVRPTPHLSPPEELAALRVPPGFVVQLVASEPDLLKPMNMAFDVHGRLWVTVSQEYPYAAPADRTPRDAVKVIELGPDGSAKRITTFADGLNIPIGLYPYRNGAIVYSIPHIWWLEDTDGDGQADRRERLYGPMGFERDTHGMNNAFRRGFDGWLYACHGFNNETRVQGRDGHEVHMLSGNTYRLRTDGQRVEQFTWGQVNPFGMAQDALGNLYTADCHSKPIYQLLRGGYYPSFGKPHDGLGFVPPMMEHLHGSTAIAGVACYQASQFPPEYRGDLFSGNVMTSRVNRNRRVFHGSTVVCQEQDDFLISDDPWFRPVDIRVGPDGALYVADFYNRIIGHYEVRLDHPGRDRNSGRIWRISYQGDSDVIPRFDAPDYARADVEGLIQGLGETNFVRRQLALDALSDRQGLQPETALLAAIASSPDANVRLGAMWALFRLGALPNEALAALARDPSPVVRTHAIKCLAEEAAWSADMRQLALTALEDEDSLVRRAAADALGHHPGSDAVAPLLDSLARVDDGDALLRQGLRIALKEHWLAGALPDTETLIRLPQPARDALAAVAPAAPTSAAANFLIDYLIDGGSAVSAETVLRHAARHADANRLRQLPQLVESQLPDQLDAQLTLCQAMMQGAGRRLPEAIKIWAARLADRLLASVPEDDLLWGAWPLQERGNENCWAFQERMCADGQVGPLMSSFPMGEQRTGKLVSPTFALPEELSFYLAGHRGAPQQPPHQRNRVELVDNQSQQVLSAAFPPRNDVAQRVQWRFDAGLVGRRARLEIIDDDAAGAYAWMAIGRFEPSSALRSPAIAPSTASQRLASAARLALETGAMDEGTAPWVALARRARDAHVAQAAARVVLQRDGGDPVRIALAETLTHPALPPAVRDALQNGLLDTSANPDPLLETLAKAAPESLQVFLGRELSKTADGLKALLLQTQSGRLSPRILRDQAIADQLASVKNPAVARQVAELTSGLPSIDEATEQIIEQRLLAFRQEPGSPERGLAVFRKHCAACHRIGSEGAVIGPQLDGIGKRGLARVTEDILDPNRNVDIAFRTTMLRLEDGRVVSGLFRREEGDQLVMANEKGEEFRVNADEIDQRRLSLLSLMPANTVRELNEQDFRDLLTFLLAQ